MQPKIEELYEQAMEAFDGRDYEKAERYFQQILDMNPGFADIQNKMGIIYNQTNRLDKAIAAFEKALASNPGYTEASLNLAITYSDLGKYDESRQVFERAARFKEEEGKTTTAVSGIDPFVRGKLADEHLRLGNMYYDLRLLDEAIEEYQKALRLSPNFADIITHLGIAYRDKGMYDEAIGKKVKYLQPYSYRYTGGGDNALVNGLRGTTDHHTGYWQGFLGNNLDVIIDRMMREFRVAANVGRPQVAYRESITRPVEKSEYRYVKQTGGRGQYGHVVLEIEPGEFVSLIGPSGCGKSTLLNILGGHLNSLVDQHGPVGIWRKQQQAVEQFIHLPVEVQEFITKPVNMPYLLLAQRLSGMPVEKLRAIAEGLLEITF